MWEYSALEFTQNQLRQAQSKYSHPERKALLPKSVQPSPPLGTFSPPSCPYCTPKTSLLESSQLKAVSSPKSLKGVEEKRCPLCLSLLLPGCFFLLLRSPCFFEGQVLHHPPLCLVVTHNPPYSLMALALGSLTLTLFCLPPLLSSFLAT